jgi:galactose mutarotase-like enzyme
VGLGITLAAVMALAASPRIVVLRDDAAGIEAAVAPSEGGELSSLRVRFRGSWIELLYRARDYSPAPGFRGRAPLLWPAVGGQYPLDTVPASSCADGAYTVGGRSYPMPCHGFAQNLEWEEVASSPARVILELRDSPRTRESYPFSFGLRAAYGLAGGRLTIVYTVTADASNTAPMPFSIGNHLSFRLPFLDGTDPADMLFETPSTTELVRDAHGLVTERLRARSFATPQRLGSFDASAALPLTGYRGEPWARLRDPRGLAARVAHSASSRLPEPLVQFNVYGGPKQGFFCPEPWFGLQNSLNRGKGLIKLAPGASWEWKIEIAPETAPAN